MKTKEAHELLSQLDRDLAAEPDPGVRAWYETETLLQPEYQLARRTMVELTAVAGLIGRVAELKAARAGLPEAGGGLDPGEITEQPRILTPEEILLQRVQKKYQTDYKLYQNELAGISAAKKSKREFQEKLARRSFARRFNDFTSVTGDANIAMRADLLETVISDICADENLSGEIFENAADFAEKNALQVTADPKNFARLIGSSWHSGQHAKDYERILKAVFSTHPSNFPQLQENFAHSAFELLDDGDATAQWVAIAFHQRPYVPVAFETELFKKANSGLVAGDLTYMLQVAEQTAAIKTTLNTDVTGLRRRWDAIELAREEAKRIFDFEELSRQLPDSYGEVIEAFLKEPTINYDPVEVANIEGQPLSIGLKPAPPMLAEIVAGSALFRKRMEQLAPFNYSIRAAKRILDSPGVHGVLIPLSPGLTVDVYIPNRQVGQSQISSVEHAALTERIWEIAGDLLSNAVDPQLGVRAYGNDGPMRIVYRPLYDDGREGIVIFRPCVPLDRKSHSPLQQLAINYTAIKGTAKLAGSEAAEFTAEDYQAANAELRKAIKDEQKRFFGRRPVKFSMPLELKQMTGLISVNLRLDQKRGSLKCLINLDDGQVELSLDRDFNIIDEGKTSLLWPETQSYYENLMLKLARKWTCGQEVHTSEGTVSERSGNAANMGHFAYLRVRPDGYRYRFREPQRLACLEEQGVDLTAESERLKDLDPSGRQRNSTYVRENYDPSQPPLEVYYSSLD